MQSVKPQVFNNFSKVQKSDLCSFLASFVKKNHEKSKEEIAENFLEEQKYLQEINSERFHFTWKFLEDEGFLKELIMYISELKKKLEYKEKQKPLYEKQKAYQKEQRKKAQEYKMAKEPATKAQKYYYKKLYEKFKLTSGIDTETASKLDLRNAIDKILQEQGASDKDFVLEKLNNLS